ncbi:MAG TPA: hypothetical protein VLW50_01215 [Streptosporangiaceae bacterium]|nr:hypothetical protein [Streptosporangiaceae bacterium]
MPEAFQFGDELAGGTGAAGLQCHDQRHCVHSQRRNAELQFGALHTSYDLDDHAARNGGSASASHGQPLAQIALATIPGSCINMHCGSRRELTHLPLRVCCG